MLSQMELNSTYSIHQENVTMEPPNAARAQNYTRNEALARVEIAVQATIFLLAILGNGAVILTLSVHRNFRRMTVMIMHLCAADLFVAFFNILPQIAWDVTVHFRGGDALCRGVKYFQVVAMYASSYVLVTTAIDRYLAICHPLASQTWTTAKMHAIVATAWLIALVMAVPQLTIFAYRETSSGSGHYDCWAVFEPEWTMKLYITWIAVAIYVIPSVLLAAAYGRICYVVWQSMTSREVSQRSRTPDRNQLECRIANGHCKAKMVAAPRAHVRSISRSKVKTVKLTLTVIICYLVCWGPFFISQMWAVWDPFAPFEGAPMVIILLLASLNSCTNPWIYLAFSASLRLRAGRCFRRQNRRSERGAPLVRNSAGAVVSTSRGNHTRVSTLSVSSSLRTRVSAEASPCHPNVL